MHLTVELEREGFTWADLLQGLVDSARDQAGVVSSVGSHGAAKGAAGAGSPKTHPDHSQAVGLASGALAVLEAALRHRPDKDTACPPGSCAYPEAIHIASAQLVEPVAMLGGLGKVGGGVPRQLQRAFVRLVYGPLARQILAVAAQMGWPSSTSEQVITSRHFACLKCTERSCRASA